MSEKKVCEIILGLSDKSNIEKDLEEALMLVSGHFREKYLERLNYAFGKCRKSSEQNPSKEVQLMQALRPFLPPERHERIDSITEMLTILSTFENIRNEAEILIPPRHVEAIEYDPAIHEDGIYEVDEHCMYEKNMTIPYEEPNINVNSNSNLAGLMMLMGLMRGR